MNQRHRFLRLIAVAVFGLCLLTGHSAFGQKGKPGGGGSPPPALPKYGITYLGTLGGQWSMTYGMNNSAQVVGLSERLDSSNGPFVYTATSGMQDLNSLIPATGWILMTARDINDAGQIVGYGYPSGRSGVFTTQSAYRYTPPQAGQTLGTVEDLGVPGPTSAQATAINNSGDVTGHFVSSNDDKWHAFLWTEGQFLDLGLLAGERTLAWAINDRFNNNIQIAGYADTANGIRAWRYDSTAGNLLRDLGVLNSKGISGPASRGLDLNNFGDVAGSSSAGRGQVHAVVIAGAGGTTDLGTLGGNWSEGFGINDFRQTVGMSTNSAGVEVAFAHSQATGIFALQPQVIGLDTARILNGKLQPWRINLLGQICGPGRDGFNFNNIHGQAYILSPIPAP